MRNQYKVLSEKYNLIQESDKEDVLAGLSAMEGEHQHLQKSIGKHYAVYYVNAETPFLSKSLRYGSIPDSVGTIDKKSVESGYLNYFADDIFFHYRSRTLYVYIINEELYNLYEQIRTESSANIINKILPRLNELAAIYKPKAEPLIQQYESQLQPDQPNA